MKMWVTSKHVLYIKNFVTFWNWIAVYFATFSANKI